MKTDSAGSEQEASESHVLACLGFVEGCWGRKRIIRDSLTVAILWPMECLGTCKGEGFCSLAVCIKSEHLGGKCCNGGRRRNGCQLCSAVTLCGFARGVIQALVW